MEFKTPIFVPIIGALFLIVGIALLVKQLKSRKNNTASVSAKVKEYITEISHNEGADSYVYFPVFQYYVNGQWYEKRSDVGRGRQKYAIGESVDLLYDPEHPENFIIAGDNSSIIAGVIAMAMGIGVILLSFFA